MPDVINTTSEMPDVINTPEARSHKPPVKHETSAKIDVKKKNSPDALPGAHTLSLLSKVHRHS